MNKGTKLASDLKYYSGYSQYIEDEERRETWKESVENKGKGMKTMLRPATKSVKRPTAAKSVKKPVVKKEVMVSKELKKVYVIYKMVNDTPIFVAVLNSKDMAVLVGEELRKGDMVQGEYKISEKEVERGIMDTFM